MVFYKYVSAERIDILQNRLIRFTQPNALNDPFEARPYFHTLGKKELARSFADMIRQAPIRDPFPNLRERFYQLHNTAGILSLSETPNNLLMWAHYAEGHTGFVLVLDGSHSFFKGNDSLLGFAKPERVEYRLELPRLAIEDTYKEAVTSEIFFVKGLDWKYEKEWRYLKFRADADKRIRNANKPDINFFRLPPKCVIGVILGCYRSKELQGKILALRRDDPEFGHLRIQQTRAYETHYRLEIGEIET